MEGLSQAGELGNGGADRERLHGPYHRGHGVVCLCLFTPNRIDPDTSRWPWALLQGVLDHGPWSPDERALDLDLITQAFSAHRRIHRTKDKINDAQVDETQLCKLRPYDSPDDQD